MKKAKIKALISGALFGVSIPISKIFLNIGINPLVLGAFTYLGAGFGLYLYNLVSTKSFKFQNPLTKEDIPYTILMIASDIFAILLLMIGLNYTNSANASLLSSFEIVATSFIAFLFFKEQIPKKVGIGVILITFASLILTYEGSDSFKFQIGSIMVLVSYCLWGLENNCTRMLSSKNVYEITIIKGLFAGLGSLIIALTTKAIFPDFNIILLILLVGFLSYGFSVIMYIKAQKTLKATLTATYFALNPYFGIIFSLLILKEQPDINFYIALIFIILAMIVIHKKSND